ncbi:hypothetical protein HPP92_010255 [Vanilla planifolia]|uniref:Uncharacterized protein n=1 Tax=Vanilla planifolia TaxID=51239 RepID=A0A835V3W5_VANPL|nr:hypothetical protein HPP92_010255 [Vanilla planifolia]
MEAHGRWLGLGPSFAFGFDRKSLKFVPFRWTPANQPTNPLLWFRLGSLLAEGRRKEKRLLSHSLLSNAAFINGTPSPSPPYALRHLTNGGISTRIQGMGTQVHDVGCVALRVGSLLSGRPRIKGWAVPATY